MSAQVMRFALVSEPIKIQQSAQLAGICKFTQSLEHAIHRVVTTVVRFVLDHINKVDALNVSQENRKAVTLFVV